jgi:hypothetical protein
MSALDRSRPARMALALFGLVVAAIGVLLGVVRQATWISLIFSLGIRAGAAAGDCWRVAGDDSSISAQTVAGVARSATLPRDAVPAIDDGQAGFATDDAAKARLGGRTICEHPSRPIAAAD